MQLIKNVYISPLFTITPTPMPKRTADPTPHFHRLNFQNLTLLVRANAQDSPGVLAAYRDQKWFAVAERTYTQERYHLEKLSDADMIYIESGFLRVEDSNKSKMIEEFKKRNESGSRFAFSIPPGVEEVPIARSALFKRQIYQKVIASQDYASHIELVDVTVDDEMTVDLFHSHEHQATRDGDYDRTVFVSTRLRFVPIAF